LVTRSRSDKTAPTSRARTATTPDQSAPATGLETVSKSIQDRLAKLGIRRLADAILHLPLRYEDETTVVPIAQAYPGETSQVEGQVVATDVVFRPRRTLVSRIEDESGALSLRFLNFYPSQVKALSTGARVRARGEVRLGHFGPEMVHPRFKILRVDTPLPTVLTPVYPTNAGVSQELLRRLAQRALIQTESAETVPAAMLKRLDLLGYAEAVRVLHNPTAGIDIPSLERHVHPAWRRIKFDELLAQQLSMRRHHARRAHLRAPVVPQPSLRASRLLASLPFRLTTPQLKVLREIQNDLSRPHPMQRLLQGDVGCGKTIIAALAALQAVDAGLQVAIMAPTEILAEQHFRKFSVWCAALDVDVAWLSGNQKKRERTATLQQIASAGAAIVVGTHALFQEQVEFQRLGLAIIDEQHRFGVHQRLALRLKGDGPGLHPHQLMMSATPIPRTLAMSYYADLDVSVIDEMPPGRAELHTRLIADSRREEVLVRVRDACLSGRQAYWVCPLIEESEALQLQTAEDTYASLRATFPDLRVGLVHGRLSSANKGAVMERFVAGELQLLVATTVIEVGVDVPNASLMVIENAERMGLAQLHQLRGRIGRGTHESHCVLLYQTPLSEMARERLKIIYENRDGFEVARNDLRLRGPGELLGARQSGIPMLRFADLETDADLLEHARECAEAMLQDFPQQAESHLGRWLQAGEELLRS
jgi:ATP-dependent DNA helicase RecG